MHLRVCHVTGVNEIRSEFIDFFVRNGHEAVASGPLVPRNDPTLLFTNAGMVQFKSVFTGAEKRPYSRAVTAQKCVRAGGKHNDLDNVGYTARHHTFFEMLGNFSFGDYFKERAIELAWKLVTREFGISEDRLVITVFAQDEEAHALWRKIAGLPEERVIRIATSDNFWAMGDTGPCGPCSEIFYDHGDAIAGGPPGSAEADGDRFVEIWNLVFMQYEQIDADTRIDLPRPSIDTGMGIERVAAVIQGTHDNYGIDLFRSLIAASVEASGVAADGDRLASHRVIADHLRAAAFLIADGVLPSNEGRGYVLRRIMRRGMRHGALLGVEEPLLHRLVPALVREMGAAYPELVRGEAMIAETLELEETRFRRTLERGLRLLEEETAGLGPGDRLPGETAFRLYDTYGFPLDLTEDALRARNISVDVEGFDQAMAAQRAEARAAWTGSGETATEGVWFGLRERLGATEFVGYETETAEGEIRAIIVDGEERSRLEPGEQGELAVNQTPFYGESGGQVGDRGQIAAGEATLFTVSETQRRLGDLIVHIGRLEKGAALTTGMPVRLMVDRSRRARARANHSATHLLHQALREVLGGHVAQKGSLVEPERLRFDFSHPRPMTGEEIEAVETLANDALIGNTAVTTRLMPVDNAIEAGALALFGEKYGEEVRVVAMGPVAPAGDGSGETARRAWSVELCGGTHVRRTGDIGLITITAEQGVAAGVRRIEALTGAAARRHLEASDRRLRQVAALVRAPVEEVGERVAALVEERRALERQLADVRRRLAMGPGEGADGQAAVRTIAGVKVLAKTVEGVQPKDLRALVDAGKKQIGSGIVAIVGISDDGKAGLVVGVTDDLTGTHDAVELVRRGAALLGGKGGGGRADMAQAGGPDAARAGEALDAICAALGAAAPA